MVEYDRTKKEGESRRKERKMEKEKKETNCKHRETLHVKQTVIVSIFITQLRLCCLPHIKYGYIVW